MGNSNKSVQKHQIQWAPSCVFGELYFYSSEFFEIAGQQLIKTAL